MTDKDLIEQLQNSAEELIKEQLSDYWRYKTFDVANRIAFSPDMVVQKRNGENLFLYIQGTDANANVTSRDAHWKDSCRELALEHGLTPHFLELVILDRKGKGNDIFIRGLMELKEELRSPTERIHQKNHIVWIAAPTPNNVEETNDPGIGEKKKQYYEEMEAANNLEAERIHEAYRLRIKGKPTDKIPDYDYCYTSDIPEDKIAQFEECQRIHGPESDESYQLWFELNVITPCPYWELTDYGTVKCNYLEEEAVGLTDESYEKAVKHFGSAEKLEEECQGGDLLADAVRRC